MDGGRVIRHSNPAEPLSVRSDPIHRVLRGINRMNAVTREQASIDRDTRV